MYKILILEDDKLETKALHQIISENIKGELTIHTKQNGQDAIKLIQATDIDLALVDIYLPDMNGLEVIKFIRGNYPKIKTIIITASDNEEFGHAAMKLNVDDYLLKPVRPRVVAETVKKNMQGEKILEMPFRAQGYINQIKRFTQEKTYSETVEVIKEFVFEILDESVEQEKMTKEIAYFLDRLKKIAQEANIKNMDKIQEAIRKLEGRTFNAHNRFDIFTRLSEIIGLFFDESEDGASKDMDMKKIINYVDRNIKKGITLEEVSDYANMSIYYMSKLFKKEVGVNFMNYVTARRMGLAKDMLENTTEPIINIAIELSYNDANYFSKAFKSNVGMTPTEYRERTFSTKI